MLQAILVRHAEKNGPGSDAPLSTSGQQSTSKLGSFLAALDIKPHLVLTSRFAHARETATRLAVHFSPIPPAVLEVDALTPLPVTEPKFSIETMINDVASAGQCLTDNSTVVFVGHEPRLTQLLTMMTRQRQPPLERLEAVCIEADTLNDLRVGRGKLLWRWNFPHPVADASRDELGAKLTGKMTVAGLLAGFNFAALLELVKEPEKLGLDQLPALLPIMNVAAIVCLTISLGLFVLAIYIYDRLSMPQAYLESLPVMQVLARRSKTMRGRSRRFGFVYAAMIRAWQHVFTPALFFALLGFMIIVGRTTSIWLFVAILFVVVAVYTYYRLERPDYSVD